MPPARPGLRVSCAVGEVGCVPYIEEGLDSGGVLRRLEGISQVQVSLAQGEATILKMQEVCCSSDACMPAAQMTEMAG